MKTATHRLLEGLKLALGDLHHDPEKTLAEMRGAYHADMVFQDPLQKLSGWDAFADMNRRLCARARKLRFQVTDMAGDGDEGFLVWTMDLELRRLPALRFDGTTHVVVRDGKIAKHRDYWDLLGALMEALPIAPVYRKLVARLG